VKLDKDALLCWKEDMTRDGEHTHLLTKYAIEDESKAKVNDQFSEQMCRMDNFVIFIR
jgi:hypothetical protein